MTFSRLVLGEPRLRGKPGGGSVAAPCEEPLTYGANILRDPGFESHLANVTAGPDSQHLPSGGPGAGGVSRLFWDLPSGVTYISDRDYYDVNGWAVWQSYDFGSGPTPEISTSNPRSGTYHLRWTYGADDYFNNQAAFGPVGLGLCIDPPEATSSRVEPGDYVEFGAYISRTNLTDTWRSWIEFRFFESDQTVISTIDNFSTAPLIGSSYGLNSLSGIAPANAYYMSVMMEAYIPSGTFTHVSISVDVDDCYLEIQP